MTRPKREEEATDDDHCKESKHRRLHLNLVVLAIVRLYQMSVVSCCDYEMKYERRLKYGICEEEAELMNESYRLCECAEGLLHRDLQLFFASWGKQA